MLRSQERDVGYIGIHNVLNYKRFQQLVSQKTGYLASQTSAVLVCRRQVGDVEKRQKLPINENTNFNIILSQHNPMRERDVHFLVTLKKSKKERKQSSRKKAEEEDAEGEAGGEASAPTSPAPSDAAMRERERISSALGALNLGALKGGAGGEASKAKGGQASNSSQNGQGGSTSQRNVGGRPVGTGQGGWGAQQPGMGLQRSLSGGMGAAVLPPKPASEYVVPSAEDPIVTGWRGPSPFGPIERPHTEMMPSVTV